MCIRDRDILPRWGNWNHSSCHGIKTVTEWSAPRVPILGSIHNYPKAARVLQSQGKVWFYLLCSFCLSIWTVIFYAINWTCFGDEETATTTPVMAKVMWLKDKCWECPTMATSSQLQSQSGSSLRNCLNHRALCWYVSFYLRLST